MIESDKE